MRRDSVMTITNKNAMGVQTEPCQSLELALVCSHKNPLQAASHRFVHSLGAWPSRSTIDKYVHELSYTFHLIEALFKQSNFIGD